jgi:hypothetical protein
VKKKPAEEKAVSQTLSEFFDKTMSPFWEASLASATFSRYELSYRLHIKPVLGDMHLNTLDRDRVKTFVVSLLQKTAFEKIAR